MKHLHTKRRAVRRSVDGNNRMEEILTAAAELFYERGYHATAIQDIAEKVGLLKGSLYHYIDSKEDLLYETLEKVITKGDEYLCLKMAQGRDPVERLRLAMEAEIEYIIENQVRVGLFLHEFHVLSARRRRKIIRKMRVFEDRIVEAVKEGQAADLIIDLDPQLAVNGILGMCNWIHRWYHVTGRIGCDEIKSGFTRMILAGIIKGD